MGSNPIGVIMNIDIWNSGHHNGMWSMVEQWQKMDTGSFNIRLVKPEKKFLRHLRTFTKNRHLYVRGLRTIAKINGKYIFLDSTDRSCLAAESWKLPFDLIVKFQYNAHENYARSKAPVVPFIYTMSYYKLKLIEKCWKMRQEVLKTRKFTSSMYWSGKIHTNRPQRSAIMRVLKDMKYGSSKKRTYERYFSEMATTQVGIAVAGTGDFTHRDFELMSVGNAFIRKKFKNTTRNPLTPNVHYYAIDGVGYGSIDKTLKYFRKYFEPRGEYRNFTDKEFDKHREISYNARKWWEDNISPQGSFELFREILEENNMV